MFTFYYHKFYKKAMEREDKLLFLHGVTRSIWEIFGEDLSLFTPSTVILKSNKINIDKNETSSKETFHRVMILCLIFVREFKMKIVSCAEDRPA